MENKIFKLTKAITQTIQEGCLLENMLKSEEKKDKRLYTSDGKTITFTNSELKAMVNTKNTQINKMIELLKQELGVTEEQ